VNHGTGREGDSGIAVCKLHGSINWIVADRQESFSKLDLLFDKPNSNRTEQNTGDIEGDYRLWRCRTREQLRNWMSGRDLQLVPQDAGSKTAGIAGLGAYKQLHQIPGLGRVWTHGMRALAEADIAIVVGFSMSDFDAMAQMQFAEVARKRQEERRPLRVKVIDPFIEKDGEDKFRRVFRYVEFDKRHHEDVDWSRITVEPVGPQGQSSDEWRQRVLETVGKWQGEVERPEQGEYEPREPLS
jgi:hypothetical protein